ncbi:MAG: DUF1858 domain-containing protein [Chloroflexi bacterium]|nr:DUF1858 domain-containing protein [Chloroflexota bacterium]
MASAKITKDMIVGSVLEKYPKALEVFLRNGFAPLANPLARKTMARAVTISQATQIHGLDADKLVDELNRACGV